MSETLSSLVFRMLGKAGLPSRSEAHASQLDHSPDVTAVPVWLFGFPRTGTTTAQALVAQALSYNASFEPFGKAPATELGFERAHEVFLGKPTQDSWDDHVTSNGVNAALTTMEGTTEGAEKRSLLENYLDALYEKFGRNTVFKEIRLIGNLDAIERYHANRGMSWICVCMESHPLRSLYTFYRIGALCSRAPIATSYPEFLYRYRVATYSRMGLYEEICELPVRSISDKLVVACLLDQAHMQGFVAQPSERRVMTSLAHLPEQLPTVAGWTDTQMDKPAAIAIRPSQRFAEDPLFRNAILGELSPDVVDALHLAGYPIPPGPTRTRPTRRQLATYARFRLYE